MKRFWSKVDKSGDCWKWVGYKNQWGYGIFKVDNKTNLAHRVSLSISGYKVPRNTCVLHHCDNPSCVNPEHLFLGTRADNMEDMDKKGRRYSKLSEEEIVWIRQLGGSNIKVAKCFGVHRKTIGNIRNRRTWKHVGG